MSIRPRRSLLNADLHRPSALHSKPRNTSYIWLDKNENLDPNMEAVLQDVLSGIPQTSLSTYPEAGMLYHKLAQLIDVRPEQIILTPGSDGAIRLVFEAFIEQNDVVAHTHPTFAMYSVYSKMFGADVCKLEYLRAKKGPFLDPQAILNILSERKPKLLCLPNPDSPTGAVLPPSILKKILGACESSGTLLLIDEAYHPFYNWTAIPWTKDSQNLVVARTFAKAWGVAGLRVGYAVAHPKTMDLLHKMRPMYEVSTIAIEFMMRMIDRVEDMEQSVARLSEGKLYFQREMRSLGFDVLESQGNFLHVAFGLCADDIHAALTPIAYYREGFEYPCLSGYSRFSVSTKPIMEVVVNIIKEVVCGDVQ